MVSQSRARLKLSPDLTRRLETSNVVYSRAYALLEKGKAYAEQISPVVTGRYRSSFRIVRMVRGGKTVVRLINVARNPRSGYPYWVALEFGTRYMRAQRILGRTADYIRRQ